MRQKLSKTKVSVDLQNEIVQRLRDHNLLDDEHYAKMWVENRCEFRPRSKRMLAYELKLRGINQEIIDHTLDHINDEELAYRAAKKQARKLSTHNFKNFRKKMYAFLSRRGFNYSISVDVVRRVWEENEENLKEKV